MPHHTSLIALLCVLIAGLMPYLWTAVAKAAGRRGLRSLGQIDVRRSVSAAVVGAARPLIDAFRIAHVELIEWMVSDYGFGKMDAYALLGQVAQSSIANVVDPLYTVVAKMPKRFLPDSASGGAQRRGASPP